MDKKLPLVSVVVPAYNAERFIRETIKSVLAQTYNSAEIIVVDDGSTDRTGIAVKEFSQKNSCVKYIYQKNQGQSSARNTGIKNAKGKYIAFLDADDLFLPSKLEEQVSYLERHPDCGVCYCAIYHFYDDKPKELLQIKDLPHPSGYIFKEILWKNFINPLAVVLRKEVLDKYGGFKEDWRRCDEQYLWAKLAYDKVKFCYLDKVLGYYRVHRQSLSAQNVYLVETAEKFFQLLDIFETMMTPEGKKQYSLNELRHRWKKLLFIGKIMANPLFSWILVPLYNLRLRKKFIKII